MVIFRAALDPGHFTIVAEVGDGKQESTCSTEIEVNENNPIRYSPPFCYPHLTYVHILYRSHENLSKT